MSNSPRKPLFAEIFLDDSALDQVSGGYCIPIPTVSNTDDGIQEDDSEGVGPGCPKPGVSITLP